MKAAGVLLVAQSTGAILLLRRRDGTWGIPGGMAEPGDPNPAATALRELAEETGYGGRVRLEPAPLAVTSWPDGLVYWTWGGTVPGPFRCQLLDGEHTAFAWVDPRRPRRPLHQGVRDLLTLVTP